ncbi:hypothetical protein [Nostoc sp. FACHB-110]|uniref:hypothetical protein n=1 Tax=Nostoc sp. FACHB-110 TaxID=2692834 RepID=UPI0016821703|nr:hypothetical protein [Nostoc sp. FACHB-110]MBD2440425.1 hypothetical protein [Nostoc sp. FACHB-110]
MAVISYHIRQISYDSTHLSVQKRQNHLPYALNDKSLIGHDIRAIATLKILIQRVSVAIALASN